MRRKIAKSKSKSKVKTAWRKFLGLMRLFELALGLTVLVKEVFFHG